MHPLQPASRVAATLLFFVLTGCYGSFALHPDSPTPKRWASDPRIQGWGRLRIVYSGWENSGRVSATVSSPTLHKHFKAAGHWRWEASDEVVARTPAEKLVQIYEFDGLAERYRSVYVRSESNPGGEAFLYLIPQ